MPKLYEALAEAFLAEGVDTQFVLMGDGNMHWCTAFAKLPGVHTVHVRHEHATVAAATAYNVATGRIAVASVTCGPGGCRHHRVVSCERRKLEHISPRWSHGERCSASATEAISM
jgi:hypothetical protein